MVSLKLKNNLFEGKLNSRTYSSTSDDLHLLIVQSYRQGRHSVPKTIMNKPVSQVFLEFYKINKFLIKKY